MASPLFPIGEIGGKLARGLEPALIRALRQQNGDPEGEVVVDVPWLAWVVWPTARGWVGRAHLCAIRGGGTYQGRTFALGEALCGLHAPLDPGDGSALDVAMYGRVGGVPTPPACRACAYEAARFGGLDGGREPSLA